MPVALTNAPERPSPPQPPRKLWTRAEISAFEATGLWTGQHLELIEGELISKMGKKPPHVEGVARMTRRLLKIFDEVLVYSEAPIDVAPEDIPTSQPEPDVIVMKAAFAGFRATTPQPGELALVVEVADTTLNFDLTVKAGLYARAAIQEYWVLDLNGRRMIVHRQPEGGLYRSITVFGENETLSPLAAPDKELLIRDVLL
jgi:Uma2 family endonuclease